MTCRKAQGYLQETPRYFPIWNKISGKELEAWWYQSCIDPDACFLVFHVPWAWQGCSCLTQDLYIRRKPNKCLTRRKRNDQKWQSTKQQIVIWSDGGWAGTVSVSEEDRGGLSLICNIPEKQLSSNWVCDDSTALSTTITPGVEFRLQSPSAKKQRALSTFILPDLWNLRAGVGRWFSKLIIWPHPSLVPGIVLFGEQGVGI